MVGFTSKSDCTPLPKIEEQTIPEFVFRVAKEFAREGRGAFLEDGFTGEQRVYKDIENQTIRIASCLYKRGLRKGDVVLYMTSHQLHQLMMMMGVWRGNGIVRSLYVDESDDTILEKLEESEARWIFCDAENASKCQNIANRAKWGVEVIVCGPEGDTRNEFANFNEFYKDDGKSCPKFDLTGDDIALIMPTSGTTGPSKGAMHNHKTVINQIRYWAFFPFTRAKPNIIASKGTHISGTMLPLSLFVKGVLGIVLSKVNKEILIQTVDKYKPGTVFAFPSFLLALGTVDAKGYDISSVETIITGGSPVTGEMYKAYMALPSVKTVIVAFGLTEGPNVSTTETFKNYDDRTNGNSKLDIPESTVGRPYPGGEIQIRDLETMEVLGPCQQGEVCCRGDYLFQGYYKNAESTKAAFIDGWFRTGDVGYLDQAGYLFIVDRAKDIFKYFHNHISPTELEGVIAMYPGVKEVCVVPIPDEGGEVPRAFVVLKNPNGKKFSELAKEIKTFADGKLATYKQLKGGLYIVDDFPKGKTGKVVRSLVAQMPLPTY